MASPAKRYLSYFKVSLVRRVQTGGQKGEEDAEKKKTQLPGPGRCALGGRSRWNGQSGRKAPPLSAAAQYGRVTRVARTIAKIAAFELRR